MLEANKIKLDFMELKQKVVYATIVVLIAICFFYMLVFNHTDVVSRTTIEGTLITVNLNTARAAFQNCVVELDNKVVIVAYCNNDNHMNGDIIKLTKVTIKNGKNYYYIN